MPESCMIRRHFLQSLALGAGAACLPALAQTGKNAVRTAAVRWPQQEVELTVPFPAGGSSARLAKVLADVFVQKAQHPLKTVHRGGGAGMAGADYVAKAPANGYHLLLGGSGMAVQRAAQQLRDKNAASELVPLALVARMPHVLLVSPRTFGGRSWAEISSELRRRPPRYRYASAGVGSSTHIAGEWLKQLIGGYMEHIPYKGSGPALQELANGNVDLMIDTVAAALPHIQSGRVRAICVANIERSDVLPDVPACNEIGLQEFVLHAWYGVFAPVGTPQPVQERVIDVFRSLAPDPVLQSRWAMMGTDWPGLYGEEFVRFLRDESAHWSRIALASGFDLRSKISMPNQGFE